MGNKINFYSSFIPKVQSGKYLVEASQTVDYGNPVSDIFHAKSIEFIVDGPKFELEQGIVHHVYPSPSIEGDYIADVPSIVFNRMSLPWERKRQRNGSSINKNDSWLILFMVDQEEQQLLQEGKGIAKDLFNYVDEHHQNSELNYIKIPEKLLELFPKDENLQYLSYCREEPNKEVSEIKNEGKKSVILCNRLPKPGSQNTVYLLSLEHCKVDGKDKTYPYLYKWSFFSTDVANYLIPKNSKWNKEDSEFISPKFTDILYNNTSEFEDIVKQVSPNIEENQLESLKKQFSFNGGTFHGLLHRLTNKLDVLKYPVPKSHENDFIKQGGMVLKAQNGGKYYRGPFQTNPVELLLLNKKKEISKKWTGAKQYFSKIDPQINTLDKSYQVAHELGSLMALKDEGFHKAFFEWKQEVSTALIMQKNSTSIRMTTHLPINGLNANKPIPLAVKEKIEAWKKLNGIPYSYLIPSTKMIPKESIRTFCMDRNWINAFLLGAFSIGNINDEVEQMLLQKYYDAGLFSEKNHYGFIIHSLAVGGWSEYEIDLEFESQTTFSKIVKKGLAKNIDLFIFDGDKNMGGAIKTLTLHLPSGKTHSGFRYESGKFVKQFSYKGKEYEIPVLTNSNNKLDITALINELKTQKQVCTPAYFGMMMLEGTPKVVFDL